MFISQLIPAILAVASSYEFPKNPIHKSNQAMLNRANREFPDAFNRFNNPIGILPHIHPKTPPNC
ncbi:hypothetical protein QQ054_35210 [Oscillatoria amoena NRMC-F 0135]|uniref:Uncharacterized protein n=1 Tax=Desertifilum tharense IPPAS B-1220 TaxID=1781255 RepID=A0ACD5GV15_9CYAN|nr:MULTISPECIES: hypothetical protein [Cyanophyceae]MBD2334270.1 hypothetical protein [Desertifilum sp. FACHB-868]MDI9638148.1 hypothetical protein [Geitlerinema splendidum]MDL5051254.1 hypothetical protein [Oscillatoria amoena NRMC-F 0135]MDL5054324.1 hypothetical protein [Oscillatoria laete-virens NRMC-F 0139]